MDILRTLITNIGHAVWKSMLHEAHLRVYGMYQPGFFLGTAVGVQSVAFSFPSNSNKLCSEWALCLVSLVSWRSSLGGSEKQNEPHACFIHRAFDLIFS